MADLLIQRYDASGPIDADGVWVDEGTVTDVPVTDEAAIQAAVEGFVISNGENLDAVRRVSNWTTTKEFTMEPSAIHAGVLPKSVRVKAS